MRVGCVLIHNFAVQLARKDKLELRGLPLIISGHSLEAKVVFDASPEAIACGVKVGMPLHEVSSLCLNGIFVQADDVSYEEVFGRVLSILDSFRPMAETSGLGCAYLDLGGGKFFS